MARANKIQELAPIKYPRYDEINGAKSDMPIIFDAIPVNKRRKLINIKTPEPRFIYPLFLR